MPASLPVSTKQVPFLGLELQPEQLGHLGVFTPAVPQRVQAWVVWEDGFEELLPAYAIAWTRRAVLVRFGAPPHRHDVWVWAGAVERA